MPVWEAQYVMTIACSTGWSEFFIRHQLPLSRGFTYLHAVDVRDGASCRWPGVESGISKHVDRVMDWVRKLWRRS